MNRDFRGAQVIFLHVDSFFFLELFFGLFSFERTLKLFVFFVVEGSNGPGNRTKVLKDFGLFGSLKRSYSVLES